MSQKLSPERVPSAGEMPVLGLGTWQNDDYDECADTIQTALEIGYRHIDTAQMYRNEDAIGAGIAAADVDREDIFLATKVVPSKLSYDNVIKSTKDSLDRLGVDYLDLLYIHWPANEYDPEETLSAFEQLYNENTIDAIGVSNFEPEHLDRAQDAINAPIFANQVEMHPLLPQAELREYTAENDLELVAYSPLARGKVLNEPTISEVVEKHGVSEAQVTLAWIREKGVTAIPKATGEDHLRDNWESLALELDDEDIRKIDRIDTVDRQIHPGFAPDAWG